MQVTDWHMPKPTSDAQNFQLQLNVIDTDQAWNAREMLARNEHLKSQG